MKNVYKNSPNFLERVKKKIANDSDLSARPETLSMTRILLGYLKSIFSFTKYSLILFSQSFESDILDSHITSFIYPNILFLPRFWTNVVFPHPFFPTTKIFPSNFL